LRKLPPIIEEPFPHLVIPDFWPDETFAALEAAWPTEGLESMDMHPKRFQLILEPGTLGGVWDEMLAELRSITFRRRLSIAFDMNLMRCGSNTNIFEDRQGYSLAAHTDVKLCTCLIYHSPASISLFKSELRKPCARGHPHGMMEEETVVDFKPNSALIFRCSPRSWHGVRKQSPRRSVQHFFK
jgi:hypothetical protein